MSAFIDFAPVVGVSLGAAAAVISAGLSMFARRVAKVKVLANDKERERDYKTEIRLSQVKDILAFEGDSQVTWFEGNFADYEADRVRRFGEDATKPHRIKYKKLD